MPNTPGTTAYLLRDWCTSSEEEYLLGRVYRSSASSKSGRRCRGGAPEPGGVVHQRADPDARPGMARQGDGQGARLGGACCGRSTVLVNSTSPRTVSYRTRTVPRTTRRWPSCPSGARGDARPARAARRRAKRRQATANGSRSRWIGVFLLAALPLVFDGALYGSTCTA